jgi:hypothetical protein
LVLSLVGVKVERLELFDDKGRYRQQAPMVKLNRQPRLQNV